MGYTYSKYIQMGAYHWKECDRNSPNYNPALEARYRILVERIENANYILDVGCGDGYLMSLVSHFCKLVVGIDADSKGLALATGKLRYLLNCLIAQATCYYLPFRDKSFDLVLLADVFEHLANPDGCLKEIRRVLAPKGTLLLTTPKWRKDRRWDYLHYKEYKPEELTALLKEYFSDMNISFFWPTRWSNLYSTKIGWRLIRIFSRYLYNPFLREGVNPKSYGQILAVCKQPYSSQSKFRRIANDADRG